MLFITIALIILLGLIQYFLKRTRNNGRNIPPGPWQFPIIGNLPQIFKASTYPPRAFDILSKTHGDIMSIRMGKMSCIVLTKYEDIVELLNREEVTGRELINLIQDRNLSNSMGIIWSNGEAWKQIRRFSLRNLRDFGFGKTNSMDIIIKNEVEEFINDWRLEMSKNNGVVRIEGSFVLPAVNIIWSLAMGARFNHTDPKLRNLLHLGYQFFKSTHKSSLTTAFPFIRTMFPEFSGRNMQRKAIKELKEFMKQTIDEYSKRPDRNTDPENFVDVFLNEMEAKVNDGKKSYFTEDQLVITLMDFFQGGSETTSGALGFAFLFLLLNPSVQNKVQKELDEVVHNGTTPSLEQCSELVYSQATVYEVLRCGNSLPIPSCRKVIHAFEYKGYFFEKGQNVVTNVHSVLYDTKFWGDPENFRPERFIKEDGTLDNVLCDRALVFGYGKRSCVGKSTAMATLFIFITSILRHFNLKQVPGQPAPTTKPKFGLTSDTYPYEILLKERSCNKK